SVIDKLNLRFRLGQRAVTLIGSQSVTERVSVIGRRDIEVRHPRGVGLIEVQARDACGRRWVGSIAVRNVKDVVLHPTKTKLIDQRRVDRVGPTKRQTLVQSLRASGI